VTDALTTAKETLLRLVRRDPRTCGINRSRWRLADLLAQCPAWRVRTPAGMWGLLARLEISYQRGRDYVHSPDPDYLAKIAAIETVLAEVRACTGRLVALYLDELTYYRQPSVAPAYAARGVGQPRAQRSHRAATPTRVVATLDQHDGRVVAWQGSKVGIAQLVNFYRQVREAYPAAARLYLVVDNWPIHYHPDVLVALEPQVASWPRRLSSSWPTCPTARAQAKWGSWNLPIQLLSLPTYASWENPIEKLWRWAKQEVLHLHPFADRLDELRREMLKFLAQFAAGSQALLRYVGLPVLD
jgi:transposase